MEIFPEEKEIIGKWVLEGKRVVADTAAQRVDYLVKITLPEYQHM